MNFGGCLSHEFAILDIKFCIDLLNAFALKSIYFSQQYESVFSLDSSTIYGMRRDAQKNGQSYDKIEKTRNITPKSDLAI